MTTEQERKELRNQLDSENVTITITRREQAMFTGLWVKMIFKDKRRCREFIKTMIETDEGEIAALFKAMNSMDSSPMLTLVEDAFRFTSRHYHNQDSDDAADSFCNILN